MAIDVYLQIDGIKGESQDDKHKDWIECESVNWAFTNPAAQRCRQAVAIRQSASKSKKSLSASLRTVVADANADVCHG